ncbi:MAG TPA: SpoIID/LytB domain-containing protein [Myxococcaceae bacterium]|nr:SpoIID/LytB domain-containing protein [Myxococcaceae bacterium]
MAICLSASAAGAVETLRIAMEETGDRVEVIARELAFGMDQEDAEFKPLARGRAQVRCLDGGLEIDGKRWEERAVRFHVVDSVEGDPSPRRYARGERVSDVDGSSREAIRVGRSRLRGDLVVRAHRNRLQLINVLPLEEYLLGVVGAEMPFAFPDEALKAQAVAARTYALKKKLEAVDQPFHLGAGVLHQVYRALGEEDARIRAAVDATRGEVLTYELEPIEAYFHASCGGRTEGGQAALSRDLPYLQPVDCPCGKLGASRWELLLPMAELSSLWGREIDSLSIAARSETGRARMLAAGPGRWLDAVDFRQRVGYGKLKSLWFEIEKLADAIKIKGRGHGHGAGMCQRGAKALADSGWSYRQILLHYYPGVEIQQLY